MGVSDSGERNRLGLTRRVWITHTDPAELVAELRERAKAALSQTSRLYVDAAADLVAEKLGVKS